MKPCADAKLFSDCTGIILVTFIVIEIKFAPGPKLPNSARNLPFDRSRDRFNSITPVIERTRSTARARERVRLGSVLPAVRPGG